MTKLLLNCEITVKSLFFHSYFTHISIYLFGARLVYILVYDPSYYSANPLEIFRIIFIDLHNEQ